MTPWMSFLFSAILISFDAGYQGIGARSRRKAPWGPSGSSVAAQTIVAAPLAGLRGANRPPIPVRTHPGQTALIKIPEPSRSPAKIWVKAFRATFDTL